MAKRVTLQDIANNFNITKVSVSKAINNQPGISEELRRKILAYAYEAGYLKSNGNNGVKANTFAFIVQQKFYMENENFYSAIFNNLNSICQTKDKRLQLFVVNPDILKNNTLNQINKNSFDGIFVGGEINENYLHMLTNLGIPMTYIDFYNHHFKNDSIMINNFSISYIATSYLIDRGHKKLGFVGNNFFSSNVMDRFYGYRKALTAYDLEYSEDWTLNNYNQQTGYYTLDFKLPKQMPTAFVCHCDMSAYFLIQKLSLLDIKVPEDISIVSFDNTLLAETCTPPLTSVDISKKEFAITAFNVLNSRILHPNNEIRQVYIKTKIVERNSVKAL